MAGGDGTGGLLPLPEVFLWGCVGGAAAGVILYLLPSALGAHRRGEAMHLDRSNVAVVTLLISAFTVLAGIAALMVGGVTGVSMAIKIGFGAQGTIKGLLAGAREALAARPNKDEDADEDADLDEGM